MEINKEKNINQKEIKAINIIYKVIFISLILSWDSEEKIFDTFDKYLGTKYKSNFLTKDKYIYLGKFFSQKKFFDEDIQKLIEHLSDIFILFLMEKMPDKYIPMLINIFDEIFGEKNNYREYYFYKMTEWYLKIRKNRDGININYKNIFDLNYLNNMNNNYVIDEYIGQKVFKNSYVFYGNNNLIIINPITVNKFSFSLRNPICNMNLIFDSDVPIINYSNYKEESLSNEEEEDEEDNENCEEKEEEAGEEDKEEKSKSLLSNSIDEKNNENIIENKNNNKIFNFDEGTEEISKRKRKSSEDFSYISNISNINNNIENKKEKVKPKEYEDKLSIKNYNIYPIRRKRSNTDLGDKYKKSLIIAEKKKMMKNSLKLFSILTELTDFKIERYKYFDVNEDNNLYNITKLIQNLDLIPLFFIHNCAFIYNSKISENNVNNIISYMNFIQKLGVLYNYNDLYPDKNNSNDFDKDIIVNQDSFTRINFNILNLTEKDENKLLEQNDIIFIWENEIGTSFNFCCEEKKIKIFFILIKITEKFYKIHRKYNTKKKEEINYIIDEIFFNEFIIDVENQSSIQMLINMIKSIDVLLKIYNDYNKVNQNKVDLIDNKEENNDEYEKIKVKSIVLDNQNILVSDDYINKDEENGNNFDLRANYIDENELMNEKESPLKKRYKLMSKL